MSRSEVWAGHNVKRARAYIAAQLPIPCPECGHLVDGHTPWVVAHLAPRWQRPDLVNEPSNWTASHRTCSDRTGRAEQLASQRTTNGKANPVGRGQKGMTPRTKTANGGEVDAVLEGGHPIESPRPFPDLPPTHPDDPVFDPRSIEGVPWLADLLEVPPEFSWPRYSTGIHPDAVGSYGLEAEEWITVELGVTLRHWQRFALRRQLEHDVEGALVWQSVIESTPRRAGKSIRLRCVALERIAHAERYGETQTVLHCGKDSPIAREIHRRAWNWAKGYGWHVKQQNGNEEIETPDESRWLVRGTPSVYGYDVGLGIVDEAWGVEPMVVDDGLEPAMMERTNPQLWLLSTAHRRATSLMRKRIEVGIAEIASGVVSDTLLLVWCAGRDDPIGDPEVWRRSSPFWSPQRRKMIGGKYDRALRGEGDAEVDDPDPLEGFRAQYLNVWPPATRRRMVPGRIVVSAAELLTVTGAPRPAGTPVVGAIEAWFTEGVAAAVAWQDGANVVVEISGFPDAPSAWAAVHATGAPLVLVGKSLLGSPVFREAETLVVVEGVGMTSKVATEGFRRLFDEGFLRIVGNGGPLADQVGELRTMPGPEGPRVVSRERLDAVKVAVWSAQRALGAPEPAAVY